jgi:uncharacterized protein
MPEYLAPGVYVEETSFRTKTIEGVSTTTAAFVGPTRYGPIDLPGEVITSLLEFERQFGDGQQLSWNRTPHANYLWQAARAFFAQGGRRLYVARVYRASDEGGIRFDAKAAKNGDCFDDGYARAMDAATAEGSKLCIRARYPGATGNARVVFSIRLGPNVRVASKAELRSVSDYDLVWISAGNNALGFYVAERENGSWRFRRTKETDDGSETRPLDDSITSVRIAALSMAIVDERGKSVGEYDNVQLDPRHCTAGAADSLCELFSFDAHDPTKHRAESIVVATTLGDGEQVLRALFGLAEPSDGFEALAEADLSKPVTIGLSLLGGHDGVRPVAADYEGEEEASGPSTGLKTGIHQLRDLEDVSIVAAPGATQDYGTRKSDADTIIGNLIVHCEQMKTRIAVIDCGDDQSVGQVQAMRGTIDSSHAAFYYPWVRVMDPITRTALSLPPSGFVAGLYARNDIERGVHKAPANEVVSLAIGFEKTLNTAQQEALNPLGINCFRTFEGRGHRLWGARTASSDQEWKYVNLRRYFAYLERSIDKGTQWAVFEPNGEALWGKVRRLIEDFLRSEFEKGALLGEEAKKAFFVRCDRTTMTQNDLDNGRLVCLVGVCPLRPAEFVIFRIGQWTGDRKV